MTFQEKIHFLHQGLPGLGVDASTGADGRRGKSIYVGHVKDFFDGIMLTEEDKGYIRIKNQKSYRLPENRQFYYKKQSNFYRALTEEIKRMTTFSIYNLHGMYLTPGKNPYSNLEQGGYDFARFGWALDLHKLIKNTNKDSLDPGVRRFKDWLRTKTSEELNQIDGKLFIEGSEAESDEGDTDSSMYFKYISLNRSIIGDTSYPNPYSVEDFENSVFPVHVGNRIDEEGVDVGNIDYLNERDLNQQNTNYNTRYTSDVLIPTSLSSKYKEGDVLYFLDDVYDNIISYVVISPDMVGCRYDYFLTIPTIPIKSLISPFKIEEERLQSYKNLVVPDLGINASLTQYKNNGVNNFIKKYDNNYTLGVHTNKEICKAIELRGDNKNLDIELDDVFKISTTSGIKLSNLWIKDCWTNINVPEYFNEDLILVDGLHVDNIDEKDFYNEYKTIRISPSKFFYSTREECVYGLIIMNSAGKVLKDYQFNGPGTHDIEYVDDLDISGQTTLKIMTYASEPKTTKYYSEISELEANPQTKVYSYSKNETINEIQDVFENDFFVFHSSNISSEECTFDVTINASEDVTLTKVYLNGIEVTSNPTLANSWIMSYITDRDSSHAIVSFNATNNLPNENNVDQRTVAEYLRMLSINREIGDKVPETSSRTVVLTAIGTKDGDIVRTSHKIVQPGFENPLKDLSVSFSNLIDNNAIEKSNISENGVLCNQVQLFTEVSIEGFTKESWGTYLEDPKIYLFINLDNDIDTNTDTDESNFNNVHFYSLEDKNKYVNNAVKAKFSWIPNKENIPFDSSMHVIEDNEIDFESYAYVFGDLNDATHIDTEWIYFSNAKFLANKDTHIPKDIIYRLEDSDKQNYIGGVSLDDANRAEKIKIRSIFEVGNPVPMEFNLKWKVEKIEIRGKVKEDLVREEDIDSRTELVFVKHFVDSDGFTYNPQSPNVKFIINPVYMTMCPEDQETQLTARIGLGIMNVGSTESPKIKVGIQDIDQAAKDEFFIEKHYDIPAIRLKESRGNYNYVSDITYYWPKKRYFQDNIQNLYIKTRDFKNDVISKSITKKNSSFVEMIDELKTKESILQNMYNISLLDVSTSLNDDYSQSFLLSTFNGYVLNPEYRNEKLSFYYNNKLYSERPYDQWNSISPLWTHQEAEAELVDSSLLTAKQTWNYEYEVSKNYVKGKSHGGVITKSGDGYLELSSEETIEEIDTGQYKSLNIYGLAETLEKSDEKVMTDPLVTDMTLPNGFANMPSEYDFFRTMLFDMKWIYPYYININNTLMVYPYYFANSYETWLDTRVMLGHMSSRKQDSLDTLKTFIAQCEDFQDEDSREYYVKDKLDENLYVVKNNYILFENTIDKTKINMFMPYNVCYDVYPRTMYNTDCKNTINVFMLQKPSIVRDNCYGLDKHYFKIPPFTDDEKENAYYADNFEEGKEIVASVLPPWYFDR